MSTGICNRKTPQSSKSQTRLKGIKEMEKILKKEKDIPCYVCSHIFENTKPVLLVSREDGDWQFLCGDEHENDSIPNLVGLSHLFERDIRLKDIHALPVNWEIERDDENSQWRIISTG